MIRVDAIDLGPSFAASVLEVVLDRLECLIDLGVDFGGNLGHIALGIPTS